MASATLALLGLAALTACGGSGNLMGGGTPPSSAPPAPAIVSVEDAPMDGVLAATVTISNITVSGTLAAGGAVNASVLPKPRTVELTELGGVRAPFELTQLQPGTYTSVTVTATAASVTYLDPTSGKPVQAAAQLGSGGTGTFSLNPALTLDAASGVDLHLDFNLPQSFDLTNNVITFTPVIAAEGAIIDKEPDTDRDFRAVGQVTATTSDSISIQTLDSQLPLTFAVTSNTVFDDGSSLSAIQVGAVIIVDATAEGDASFTADEIDPVLAGEKEGGRFNDTGAGTVISVTDDSSGNLASFDMVTRGRFYTDHIGRTLTVTVNSSTVYRLPYQAQNAGANTFDAAQIFPGQTVMVDGMDADVQAGSLTAKEVILFAGFHHGLLAAAVQGTSPNFTFNLTLDPLGAFEMLAKVPTLGVATSQFTRFGDDLTLAQLPGLAVGTALRVRGYILVNNGAYTDYAIHLNEPE